MIAKMQKVFLIALEHSRAEALETLKRAGVMHLEEYRGQSEELEELQRKKALLERGLSILPLETKEESGSSSGPVASRRSVDDGSEIAKRLEQLYEELQHLKENVERITREEERIAPLGDFSPKDIAYLEERGTKLQLFEAGKDEHKQLPEDLVFFDVMRGKNRSIIAVIGGDETAAELAFLTEFPLPENSLEEMRISREKMLKESEKLTKEIDSLSSYRRLLQKAVSILDGQIEFEEYKAGMAKDEEEGKLVYISGYVPQRDMKKLRERAAEGGWALLLREPEEDENPPTLTENPPAVQIIKPVFDFLGTVPGYREYDISVHFLLFLTVFFAMIIGDAGYGVLFFATTAYSAAKCKKNTGKATDVHKLLLLMSGATIVWGLLSGTWFGSRALAEAPVLSWFVLEPIASFGSEISGRVIRHLCFIIGTVQIAIAHIMNFAKELRMKPKIRSLAQLGWLSMVLGLYYVVLYLVLGADMYPVPQHSLYMVFGGLAAVFIFSEQEGNFFKGIGKGLANFLPKFLDSISAFSDIISYIRLFAVGLATVEIAKSFNSMAADMGSGVVGIVGGIIILLIGHGLNIAMAALSVVVHGVRLNMLEFSGHLGMEWTGVPYSPFRYSDKE